MWMLLSLICSFSFTVELTWNAEHGLKLWFKTNKNITTVYTPGNTKLHATKIKHLFPTTTKYYRLHMCYTFRNILLPQANLRIITGFTNRSALSVTAPFYTWQSPQTLNNNIVSIMIFLFIGSENFKTI